MMGKKVIFLAAVLGTIDFQCGRREAPAPIEEKHALNASSAAEGRVVLSETARQAAGIEVDKAVFRQCRCAHPAMGKVLAPQPQTAIVGHAFPARVAEVHIKIGDWVEKGQALVTLESHEVGAAKSEFFKAMADLELAKLNFEREKRLLDGGIGVEKTYLAAETEYEIAQASEDAAEKRLHVLGFTEEEVKEITDSHQISPTITLYAPISGNVVSNEAVLGALVDQSTEILTIMDPRLLWVDAEIYERDLAKIKIEQGVEITVPAYPQETFTGEVSHIGDIVNEETRTITVRANVKNDDRRLKPGMFANVCILLNGGYQALVVPSAAVLEEGYQKIVFVKHDDSFQRREVKTGDAQEGFQEIVEGLEAGEEVVIKGNHLLKSVMQEEMLRQHHHTH